MAITKDVSLQGGHTTVDWNTPDPVAHPTILDAGGRGRVIVISGTITPTLTGFRLTGGNAQGLGGIYWGGAGGGLYIRNAMPLIGRIQIYSNTSPWYGGGLYITALPPSAIISSRTTPLSGEGAAFTWMVAHPFSVGIGSLTMLPVLRAVVSAANGAGLRCPPICSPKMTAGHGVVVSISTARETPSKGTFLKATERRLVAEYIYNMSMAMCLCSPTQHWSETRLSKGVGSGLVAIKTPGRGS